MAIVLRGLQILCGTMVTVCIQKNNFGAAMVTWATLTLVFILMHAPIVVHPFYRRMRTGSRITLYDVIRLMVHVAVMVASVIMFILIFLRAHQNREPMYFDLSWLTLVVEFYMLIQETTNWDVLETRMDSPESEGD